VGDIIREGGRTAKAAADSELGLDEEQVGVERDYGDYDEGDGGEQYASVKESEGTIRLAEAAS
jgi:hypothetical protein